MIANPQLYRLKSLSRRFTRTHPPKFALSGAILAHLLLPLFIPAHSSTDERSLVFVSPTLSRKRIKPPLF
ncbi:hypothetical protein TcWFU_004184 [Taenia crassiceps]|uniref:Uncharacterized protein n=1 Tax=Taenia crassiceps TaxID=6207 RepID=A0ABR4QQK7_9CEST